MNIIEKKNLDVKLKKYILNNNYLDLKILVNKYYNDDNFDVCFAISKILRNNYVSDKMLDFIIKNFSDVSNYIYDKDLLLKCFISKVKNYNKLSSLDSLYVLKNKLNGEDKKINGIIPKLVSFLNEDDFMTYIKQDNNIDLNAINEIVKNNSNIAKKVYKEKINQSKIPFIEDKFIINSMYKDVDYDMISDKHIMNLLLRYGNSISIERALELYFYNIVENKNIELPKNYIIINELEDKLLSLKDYDILLSYGIYLKKLNSVRFNYMINKIVDLFIKEGLYDYIIKASVYLDNSLLDNFDKFEKAFIAIDLSNIDNFEKNILIEKALDYKSKKYYDSKYKDKDLNTIIFDIKKDFKNKNTYK